MLEIDIITVPKPRMTRADKWLKRDCVVRYRAFCDELNIHIKEIPEILWVTFVLPMPDSWSNKKKESMNGKPHLSRPDLDNCVKSVCDASGKDDARIHEIHARKIWGYSGKIIFGPFSS